MVLSGREKARHTLWSIAVNWNDPRRSREHQMPRSLPSRSRYFPFPVDQACRTFCTETRNPMEQIPSGFDYIIHERGTAFIMSATLFLYCNHPNSVEPLLYCVSFTCHAQRGGARVKVCSFCKCFGHSHVPCVLRKATWNRRNLMWHSMCVTVWQTNSSSFSLYDNVIIIAVSMNEVIIIIIILDIC